MAHRHLRPRFTACAVATTTVVAVGALSVPVTAAAQAPSATAAPALTGSQAVLDWERIAMRTLYAPAPPATATPIPTGVPILGFTSVAMYDAVRRSLGRATSSEAVAAAVAAHRVLRTYKLEQRAELDGALEDTLEQVPEGRAKTVGIRVGRRAAARMIESRHRDGYNDPTWHYSKPTLPGFWQPPTSGPVVGDMLAPWLGSLRRLVVRRTVAVDGPPALTSARYARDFDEVKRLGAATGSEREQTETDTAVFFDSNSATMVGDALVRRLEENPLGVRRTARIFAAMHAAMTDSVIRCWQLKRDVGFWRPFQAIQRADEDGNPATEQDLDWAPLRPMPPYADYVSGHASLTGPAVEVIRRMMGETTQLKLISVNFPTDPRTYPTLRELERDAFMARIWGGFHFRTAMRDGYRIGHRTARIVLQRLP